MICLFMDLKQDNELAATATKALMKHILSHPEGTNLNRKKAYRPNAHLLYTVMHYNGNINYMYIIFTLLLL